MRYEDFVKQLQIEARVLGDMVFTQVVPAAVRYQELLSRNVAQLTAASIKKDKLSTQIALIERVSDYINQMVHETEAMVEERKKANKIADIKKRAIAYTNKVKPYFEKIRYNSDKLEQLVSDDLWPIPKYREMLFVK